MNLPNSFWENEDGSWTLASELVRELCHAEGSDQEIEPVELYFILDCFGVKKRFADYWDWPEFYQRIGLADVAHKKIDTSRDGWRTKQGDIVWAAGNKALALTCYEKSILFSDSCLSGWGGKYRMLFIEKQFQECVNIFDNICPSHSFYVEYNSIFNQDNPDFDFNKATDSLLEKHSKTSPYFISDAKYMLNATVYAVVNITNMTDSLRIKISDYFGVTSSEVDTLVDLLMGNENEFDRIRKRVEPKRIETTTSEMDLLRTGKTARALHICSRLTEHAELVQKLSYEISEFVQHGEKALIEQCVKTPLFNIKELDRILYRKALSIITSEVELDFSRDIILARQFGLTMRYGKSNHAYFDNVRWWKDVYGAAFAAGWKLLPIDIVIGISRINWYKQPEFADSHFLIERFEWASTFLVEYLDSHLKVCVFDSDKSVLSFLQNAYLSVYSRFEEAQSECRWVSEELLSKAIESLFGKGSVVRHAQPIWLTPQHLDIFVPEHNLAIEYMGKQHYEPVEIFGGEDGFDKTKERDERKLNICNKVGVSLEYVTHVEDIGKRAKEIHKKHSQISLPSGKG